MKYKRKVHPIRDDANPKDPGKLNAELAAVKEQVRALQEREKHLAALFEDQRRAFAEISSDLKALSATEQVYRAAGETFRFGIWVASPDGTFNYFSPSFLELLDMTMEEVVQQATRQLKSFDASKTLMHPEDAASFRSKWLHSLETGEDFSSEFRVDDREGRTHQIRAKGRVVRDEKGNVLSWAGTHLDITKQKQDEEEIRRQAELLHELSTPVLEISAGLLIVPLIGPVSSQRAKDFTEQLLQGVRNVRARAVVIDVTGVPRIDSFVANHLIQTAEACRLLGAAVILTGISTPIAQVLTEVGVQLTGINTAGNLRSGIELAQDFLIEDAA